MFDKIIKDSLSKIITDLKLEEIEISLEHPAEEKNGDFASNIALALFSKVSKEKYSNPRELALEILEKLKNEKEINEICQKIEIAGPGFLNFYLKDEVLIEKIFDGENFAKKKRNNKKLIIEFTDPNPFKLFHIGHLYSNSVGESLCRIFEFEGWEVRRANYQGDVGMHVAKAVWGVSRKLETENKKLENIEKEELGERIKFLGEAYVMGSFEYKENEDVKKEIQEINYLVYISAQKILEENEGWEKQVDYEKFLTNVENKYSLSDVKNIYEKGRKWSLEYFENIYKKLGTKFDHYFFESKTGEYGIKIVREFLEKGIFEKSDGAIVYKGEKDGLHTRVFVNSLGLPTYEAKDLGLAPLKYETFTYDKSIIVTANEINEYFKVILKVLEKINPELAAKTKHISHGVVKLSEGKMSSRTGKVITGDDLMEDVKERILKVMEKSQSQFLHGKHGTLRHDKLKKNVSEQSSFVTSKHDKFRNDKVALKSLATLSNDSKFDEEEKSEIADKLSIAGIKYAFLKNNIGGDIVFDFDKSLSLSGNSGPYVEYTYARCKSVLRKQGKENNKLETNIYNYELNDSEKDILRYIYRFEETVYKALNNFNPGEICNFVYELCQRFNSFYNKYKIINLELSQKEIGRSLSEIQNLEFDKKERELLEIEGFRIRLTEVVSKVIGKSLNLLGIETVERM